MGIFDKLKKKPEPEPIIDEKRIKEIEKYQAKDYQVIRDLQVKPLGNLGTYIEGKVYCKLWDKEIDVCLYDEDVTVEYAEKCAEAMNSMPDELVDTICREAKRYCLEFLDAIGGVSENGIHLTVPVDEKTPPREMLKCFYCSLVVDTPEDPTRTGYQLSGNCDWEEEHGIEIDILDGKLVYLGEFTGYSPWGDPVEEY